MASQFRSSQQSSQSTVVSVALPADIAARKASLLKKGNAIESNLRAAVEGHSTQHARNALSQNPKRGSQAPHDVVQLVLEQQNELESAMKRNARCQLTAFTNTKSVITEHLTANDAANERFRQEVATGFENVLKLLHAQGKMINFLVDVVRNGTDDNTFKDILQSDYVQTVASVAHKEKLACEHERRVRDFNEMHKIDRSKAYVQPRGLTFPVTSAEEIKQVMADQDLKAVYLHRVTFVSDKITAGAAELCEAMVGRFNPLTRQLNFTR